MTTPFLSFSQAKVTPPRLPLVLNRPRLFQRLEQGRDGGLVLILGQAAQGKTTLAAAYLAQAGITPAWINLGPEDSDPVNLFHSLAGALDRALPQAKFLASLKDSVSFDQGPRALVPMYRDWVSSLLDPIPESIFVVLDGLDNLAEEAPSLEFIKVLLQEAPQQVRLMLLSRHRPSFNLEEIRASRRALILESKDLAFTPEETREFFAQVRDSALSKEQADKIHHLVEGWIGGLILFSEYLDRLPPGERDDYLAGLHLDRFKRDVFQYFGENIFAALKPEAKDFLAGASLFEVLDPHLIKGLYPGADAVEILKWLAGRNFFVSAIPAEQGGHIYRFHQIFKEFMRAKLESGLAPEQVRSLLVRAGDILRQGGDREQALKLYLEAGDHAKAAELIRGLGLDLLQMGRLGDLIRWLKDLPPEMVEEDPWLLLYLCLTRRWTEMGRNLAVLPRVLAAFAEARNLRGRLICLAFCLEASFGTAQPWSHIAELIEQSRQVLASGNPGEHSYERAVLWAKIGCCHSIRGNPRQSVAACEKAFRLANRLRDINLQCETLPHYIDALVQLGEFDRAQDLMEKFEKITGQSREPTQQVYLCIVKSFLALFTGGFNRAGATLARAQSLVEEHGLLYMQPPVLLYHLMWSVFSGNYAQAEQIGAHLSQMASAMGGVFYQGIVSALLGLGAYEKGDFARAGELLKTAVDIFSSDEGRSEMHLHGSVMAAALIQSHLDGRPLLEKEMQASLDYFQEIKSPCRLAEGLLSAALLKHRQGKSQEATEHLRAGLEQAKDMQVPYMVWISRAEQARALALALEWDIPGAREMMVRLSLTDPLIPWEAALQRLEKEGGAGSKERVHQARLALRRGTAPRLRLKTLGRFTLLREGEPLTSQQWGGKQPQEMLKALIAQGARGVSKDLLMQSLWPQALPADPERSFNVALHRLRKVLEPDMDSNLGSLYLRLEGNTLSLDPELCSLDLDEFKGLLEQGRRLEKQGQAPAALEKYREAAGLYHGDFLPQDLYAPWAQPPRQGLRRDYLDLLMNLAGLHEARGSLKKAAAWYAKALQLDPCWEEACRRLMDVLGRMGRTAQALEAFHNLEDALGKELDARPEESTLALYLKIKQEK